MKILFYSPYSLEANSLPVLLDEAVGYLQDSKNEVLFVTCSGEMKPCDTNAEQSPIRCTECKISSRLLLNKIKYPNFNHKELNYFKKTGVTEKIKGLKFDYETIEDVKDKKYLGVNIGLGTVSSYVSMTRNLNPAFNETNKLFFDDSLKASSLLVELSIEMINHFKPDLICIFNGRYNSMRSLLEVTLIRKIELKVLECTFSYTREEQRKVEFINALPHDIDNNTPIIENNWKEYNASIREKMSANFFEKRRKGEMASDTVYTVKQQKDLLPANFDTKKRNYVIFNSSEDEFFCVGDSFDKYKLFKDQVEGIKYLVNKTVDDTSIHYYLRVHPSLEPIPFYYHAGLKEIFSEFKNITVILASSPISTYKLIDNCEKVFVFGSTVGVEATYWHKPVILLGGAFYLHLNAAYYPKDLVELDCLLIEKLQPKSILGALKYGLFIFGQRGIPYQYINFNYKIFKIAGKSLTVPRCFEYKGLIIPYVLLVAFFRIINIIPHLYFKKITMKKMLVEQPLIRS